MEDAVDNWEDLLNDDAAFDKIVQLKEDGFEDEDVEPDQLEVQQQAVQTGPAQPSQKKLLQKEQKRKMMEKLETTKKKYEENAFGNIMLPQDKRNLKLQQHLLSQKQDEMNIASLVGEQQEEQIEIAKLQFTVTTKDNMTNFLAALTERLKTVEVALQQEMLIRGIEEALKHLGWSSKETGKMFEKTKTFLVLKEKKERSNKKDKTKQVHVNLSKAATKKLAVEEEEDSEEEEVYEAVDSDEEEKKEQAGGNVYQQEMEAVKLENVQQAIGFIVRCIEIMRLVGEEKSKREWSVETLVKIGESACEGTQIKDWKENVMEKVKGIHNQKMNEEKGTNQKKKNPLMVSVNAGKATEIDIALQEEAKVEEQDEFDPDEDFM